MPDHRHPDYAKLRDLLVVEHVLVTQTPFQDEWRCPDGSYILVEIPHTDPYESVIVHFDRIPTRLTLESLGFPL